MEQSRIVVAINGKGVVRKFSRTAWGLLGPNKHNWVEVVEQPIQNISKKTIARPATGEGQATQKFQNSQPPKEDKVEQPVHASGVSNETGAEVDEQTKQEFYAAAKGLNAGPIKDYFDSANPRIVYNKASGKQELIKILAENLNYNVVELQKIISA